jgi:hypothetical protein
MGDVAPYFGVCTDVVVRAYRALGIDLQVLVHKAGAGAGDTNIDHRRVEVLRRFFGRAGTSLAVTSNPADYKRVTSSPTMPNGWLSKTHIASFGPQIDRRRSPHHSQQGLRRDGGEPALRRADHRPLPLLARSRHGHGVCWALSTAEGSKVPCTAMAHPSHGKDFLNKCLKILQARRGIVWARSLYIKE